MVIISAAKIAGFHVRFDRAVSMLEPLWIEETETEKWPSSIDADGTIYETCLRLKLNPDAMLNIEKLTQDILEVLNGQLILFLNKLQRLILEDARRACLTEHCCNSLSRNWLITHMACFRSPGGCFNAKDLSVQQSD